MKIVVTIPAYNEEKTVDQVVADCEETLSDMDVDAFEILVVDDGSTDNTAGVAEEAGATVVSHHVNRGLGRTFATGLREALKHDADLIVNIDADGQYEASDLPRLVEPVVNREADMVIGDREVFTLDHMPRAKQVGNTIGTWVTSWLSGHSVADAQSGFRVMTREVAARLQLSGVYTYVQESIIQAAHKGFTIQYVPITFYARSSGDSRLIGSLREYIRHAAKIVIRTYRDYKPMRTFSILALVFFLAAMVPGYQVAAEYLSTGKFDMVGRGLLVTLLLLGGGLTLIFGLLADMMKEVRSAQEEVLYELRE